MTNDPFPYEVIDEYVRGGCSVIYRIKPKDLTLRTNTSNKTFVLKTMLPDEDDPAAEKRFYMEYEFLRAYPHPNLVEVVEYFPKWKGYPAYVMEWVEGDTWHSYWKQKRMPDELPLFFSIFEQLCDVLDFIHNHQIIHRDLKPQNILITQNKTLKLIDFGIMKVQDLTMFTNRNSFMGSAYYVAPECLSGDEVSPAADIFSLGVMVYDLLTGTKPFRGHTLAETVYQRLVTTPKAPSTIADLPPELDDFFIKILHIEPHKRHASCRDVFLEIKSIMERQMPIVGKPMQILDLDVCTKSQFLHTLFLEECVPELLENKVLYLYGAPGTGKDTILENLPNHLDTDLVLKIDIQPSMTPNDLMEIILQQLPVPSASDRNMTKWLHILKTALPQLEWKVQSIKYQIQSSSILTAFLNVIEHSSRRVLILLSCTELPSTELTRFLNHFMFYVSRECQSPTFILFSSEVNVSRLTHLNKPKEVPFPDMVTLSEFLSSQFNQARVPLRITKKLASESNFHLQTFLRGIERRKKMGTLTAKKQVLTLSSESDVVAKAVRTSNTIPSVLSNFSEEQVKHLEWLALNPEGVDINVLKHLTHVNLETLSDTLTKAKEYDLLDFQRSSTQGLIWKKKAVRDFLLNSIDDREKATRTNLLAETIEKLSQPYIDHSPPLWRIISNLYLSSEHHQKAALFAMRYARYCFQSAQYESLRDILTPFLDLPHFQKKHDFWFYIASAYRHEDPILALEFVKKAARIDRNASTQTLLAIIEFDLGNYTRAFNTLDVIFRTQDLQSIDINLSLQLITLLLASNQISRAKKVLEWQKQRFDPSHDLYAKNLLVIAKMQILERKPQKALDYLKHYPPADLLPKTKMQLYQIANFCHQSLFQYQQGLQNLENLRKINQPEGNHEQFMFLEEVLFFLNFHQFKMVKKLLSDFQKTEDQVYAPVLHLVSQILTSDPQVYEEQYILNTIKNCRLLPAVWMPLFCSLLNPLKLTNSMIQSVLNYTANNVPFWSKHQTPRFMLLKTVADKEFNEIPTYLNMALSYSKKYKLPMEALRLEVIQNLLISENVLTDRIPNMLPADTQHSANALQFLTSTLF
ncbi:MAG: hypothetical protein CR997_04965 [Acidobacteria bacterium]|nr:MAG: hypothetical protein CR997_04965 [Acidobacteriota bacterium]